MSGKIAVMGAGAVGCWYGGQLALAGENVVLIGRPALAKVLATRGLRLEQAGQSQEIALQASSDAAAVAGADLVLFCVKSGDTTAAGRQIAPYLSPDAVVLSLQNGISNAAELEAILGRPVIPVVVYVAVDLRKESPSFGQWAGVELSAENGLQLYIPAGFGHGFVTREADTEIVYKCSDYYAPDCDGALRWNDPAIGIDWGITAAAGISEKDARAPLLADFDSPFLWAGV